MLKIARFILLLWLIQILNYENVEGLFLSPKVLSPSDPKTLNICLCIAGATETNRVRNRRQGGVTTTAAATTAAATTAAATTAAGTTAAGTTAAATTAAATTAAATTAAATTAAATTAAATTPVVSPDTALALNIQTQAQEAQSASSNATTGSNGATAADTTAIGSATNATQQLNIAQDSTQTWDNRRQAARNTEAAADAAEAASRSADSAAADATNAAANAAQLAKQASDNLALLIAMPGATAANIAAATAANTTAAQAAQAAQAASTSANQAAADARNQAQAARAAATQAELSAGLFLPACTPRRLRCPEKGKLRIVSAVFGLADANVCPSQVSTTLAANSSCSETTFATTTIQQKCNGLESCTINMNEGFIDHCPNFPYRYLSIKYECVPSRLQYHPFQNKNMLKDRPRGRVRPNTGI